MGDFRRHEPSELAHVVPAELEGLAAGRRALQRGRRSLIVAIDNRAREMSRDFGVPTVGRAEVWV
jgi:hypothetical protein